MSIFDKIANYLGTPVKEVGKQFQRDAQASLEFPEQSIIGLTNASQAVQGGIEDASVWAINKEKELGVPEGIANLDALPSVISRMALPQTEEETGAMLATPLVNPVAKFMVEEGSIAGKGMYQGGKALVDKLGGMLPPPPPAMEPALAEGLHIPNALAAEPITNGAQISNSMIGPNAETWASTKTPVQKDTLEGFNYKEITDVPTKLNTRMAELAPDDVPITQVLTYGKGKELHPLIQAYPILKKYKMRINYEGFSAIDPDKKLIYIALKQGNGTPKEQMMHELTHLVQMKEGWKSGGMPEDFKGLPEVLQYEEYKNLSGEVNARDTANRIGYSQEELDAHPRSISARQAMLSKRANDLHAKVAPHQQLVQGSLGEEAPPKPYAAPFYSFLEQTVQEKMPNQTSGKSLQGLLTNAAVKKEELQYSGMDELFEKPMVTKQEVLDHLQANKIELKEIKLGNVRPDGTTPNPYIVQDAWDLETAPREQLLELARLNLHPAELREALATTDDDALRGILESEGIPQNPFTEIPGSTKFDSYQLPGGKNYKEMLFQLPSTSKNVLVPSAQLPKPVQKLLDKMLNDKISFEDEFLPELESHGFTTTVKQEGNPNFHMDLDRGIRKLTSDPSMPYQSSHFDEPNVLAHTRFNEVKDANGKKVLRIEEIQSDWHQEGRDIGYTQPNAKFNPDTLTIQELQSFVHKVDRNGYAALDEATKNDLTEMRALVKENVASGAWEVTPESVAGFNGVPDAPFKKNWHEMVMRRMIRYAAENGFDKIAWTTGEQQAKRYPGLIKEFEAIRAELKPNGTYDVYGAAKDQLEHRLMGNFPEAQLTGAVGKDLAQKIVQQKGGEFTGLDLKVGDHGMKVFYDEMLPSYVNKFTKKWGGQVTDEAYPVKGIRALKPYEKEELKDTVKSIMQNDHTFEEAQEKVHELLPDFDLTEELYEDMLAAGRDRSRGSTAAAFAKELIGLNKANKLTLHTLSITPEMKRAALTKGFPLFSGAVILNYLSDGKEEKKKGVQ